MLDVRACTDFKHVGDIVTTPYYDIDCEMKRTEWKNAEALDQGIENLILTMPGERLFNVDFGSHFYKMLFENSTNVERFKDQVLEQVENYIGIIIDRDGNEFEVDGPNHVVTVHFRYSTPDGIIINHEFRRKFTD